MRKSIKPRDFVFLVEDDGFLLPPVLTRRGSDRRQLSAIDWSGQDYLIEVLLLDLIRDSTARPEVRALVQRVLRHVA